MLVLFFFFQAEDGIRDKLVTGVQTCALPISSPDRFEAGRPQAYGHASFGFGAHFCLGAGLARMEAKALFTELISRYGSIRLAGTPSRYEHVQLNGWAALPVTLHR